MNRELLQERTDITKDELKTILATEGPCISILIPRAKGVNGPKQNALRLKSASSEAEKHLSQQGVSAEKINTLLQPVRAFTSDSERACLLLRSPELFRPVRVGDLEKEGVWVGDHFEIRPVLRELEAGKTFYILALALKDIRLLRCTDHSSEEVPLPPPTPKNLTEWANNRQPDHNLENRATPGPSAGTSKGVMFGTSTDREDKDEYWTHFYTEVDKGVIEILRKDSGAPLVLAGVEKELAIYHKVTKYEGVVPGGVHGSPDSLKGGEMHKRALAHLRAQLDPRLVRALALYEKSVSAGRTSHQVNQCVKAAYEGRVAHLFLTNGAAQMGDFDKVTERVRQHGTPQPGDEDLLNAAAAETIRHSGEVHPVDKQMAPNNSVIAALLRF